MPTLTAEEIAQLNREKTRQENTAAAMTSQIPAQTARAAELGVADGAFAKFFSYYNDDIIGKYDAERRAINGQYIASPISETDILNCANLVASRTTPTLPATDIVRCAQFDGTPLASTTTNELQHIADQVLAEDALVNGFVGGTYPATLETSTALTSASTTLSLTDSAVPIVVAPGEYFTIKNGSAIALVKVISITPNNPGTPPPYVSDLVIQLIVAPSTTIPSGNLLTIFDGFNNTERTSKTAADSQEQPLMTALIANLELYINRRITRLNEQLAALAANLDPEGTAQSGTAIINCNTSKTFLTNYLVTTSISNTGITSLTTERGVRGGQTTTRLAQILSAYTGRTENYYNKRYSTANDRANTSRGTLRLQKAALAVKSTCETYAAAATAAAASIEDLLS